MAQKQKYSCMKNLETMLEIKEKQAQTIASNPNKVNFLGLLKVCDIFHICGKPGKMQTMIMNLQLNVEVKKPSEMENK